VPRGSWTFNRSSCFAASRRRAFAAPRACRRLAAKLRQTPSEESCHGPCQCHCGHASARS
jgi:hypothetical protein